jgi:SSS family solute:Na+ symporter
MVWNGFDYFIATAYLAGLLALGILAGRKRENSNQFLNASRSLPLWICVAACIAANCGSLDVIAMMALGAQYGVLACHFYWIGSVPALVVVAFWLLPAYARGRYPTILDFIAHYYGGPARSVVALCMAAMMLLLAGVCLCAVAQTLTAFLGWTFGAGVLITAVVVLFYTWIGGLRATIYTELLHFAVVLAAVVPLFFLLVRGFGGFGSLMERIPPARLHAWRVLPFFAPGAIMDQVGVVFGLGLVLSFGFWSTDFVQMQRALAVRRPADVPFVPLSIAAAKIVFAVLIVLPGIAAPLVLGSHPVTNWNTTLPSLMLHYFRPSWAVVGLMGLAASLISTFANNVAGFSSAWVQGVYQVWIRPRASDRHYFWMGRTTTVLAVVLSIGAAYSALHYESLMEYIQMILATFNAPLFALVALAAVTPQRAAGGGLIGLFAGVAAAGSHQVLVYAGLLHYGSRMTADFYAAILSFIITAAAVLLFGSLPAPTLAGLQQPRPAGRLPISVTRPTLLWALLVSAVCILLNVVFR